MRTVRTVGWFFAAGFAAMSVHAETVDPVIAQVQARDAEIAAAHGRGDLEAYRAGLSSRYTYVDIGGKRVTADMLLQRREGDQRRVVSSKASEDEAVRIADDVVLLRGLEESKALYFGGLPRHGLSRWTALWVREDDGVWRIVAETSTPVRSSEALPFVHAPQPASTLEALAGRWSIATEPPLELTLAARDGTLVGTLAGASARFTFKPASATHWFAEERPFELRIAADGRTMDLVTWGTATAARRVVEP